jgi:hypothetical protein
VASAGRSGLEVLDERATKIAGGTRQGFAGHVVEPLQDGFGRVAGGAPADDGSRGRNMLFVGIGMVIGLLYTAILALWLLIVRPRWSVRG